MPTPPVPDEILIQVAESYRKHGRAYIVAQELGIPDSTARRQIKFAAQRGLLGTSPVMPGFSISKVSTTLDKNGDCVRSSIQQRPDVETPYEPIDGMALKGRTSWVKDGFVTQEVYMERHSVHSDVVAMRAAIEAFKEEIPRVSPVPGPTHTRDDLLNQFTVTDSHFGMLAWGEETGADYDIKIAEKLLLDWFAAAIATCPKAHTAVFAQLGDLMHHDALESVTPAHKHVLDADSRLQKIIRVVIRVLRQIIGMLLETHAHVHLIMASGNHDPASSAWLREMLASMYELEPRITVDSSPGFYYAFEWGATALFYHHGHKRTLNNVDSVFAGQFKEIYGRSLKAYGHTGHKHSDKVGNSNLMKMEQHETLAAKDAYAAGGGWFSGRSAKVITYHKQYGEVWRSTMSPEMVAGAYAA